MNTFLTLLFVGALSGLSYAQRPAAPIAQNATWAKPANTYYLTKKGSAVLKDGKRISGSFYYSSPPFWGEDFFFYYPDGIKSREKIFISDVSTISIYSETEKTDIIYTRDGDRLKRTSPNGIEEELTVKVFRKIK